MGILRKVISTTIYGFVATFFRVFFLIILGERVNQSSNVSPRLSSKKNLNRDACNSLIIRMYEPPHQSTPHYPQRDDFFLQLQNALAPHYAIATAAATTAAAVYPAAQPGTVGPSGGRPTTTAVVINDINEMQRYQMMAAAAASASYPGKS